MDAQFVQETGQQILELFGPRNILSILIVNLMVRMYRARKWRSKKETSRKVILYSIFIGAGTIILTTDIATVGSRLIFAQQIGAGIFLTYFGSMLFYEILRWGIRFAIELRHKRPGEKTLISLYWFLNPSPPKIKRKIVGGGTQEIELDPCDTLTKLNDKYIRNTGKKKEVPK